MTYCELALNAGSLALPYCVNGSQIHHLDGSQNHRMDGSPGLGSSPPMWIQDVQYKSVSHREGTLGEGGVWECGRGVCQ